MSDETIDAVLGALIYTVSVALIFGWFFGFMLLGSSRVASGHIATGIACVAISFMVPIFLVTLFINMTMKD